MNLIVNLIVVKYRSPMTYSSVAQFCSDTAMLWTKIQNDLAIEIYALNK